MNTFILFLIYFAKKMLIHFFFLRRGRIVRFNPLIRLALIQLLIHAFLAIQQDQSSKELQST